MEDTVVGVSTYTVKVEPEIYQNTEYGNIEILKIKVYAYLNDATKQFNFWSALLIRKEPDYYSGFFKANLKQTSLKGSPFIF